MFKMTKHKTIKPLQVSLSDMQPQPLVWNLSLVLCRLFVICLLLFVISSPAQADAVADRWLAANKVEAPSYILIDLDSGRILAQKNAHQRREPASTTKMMTSLVAIESGKLDQTFTIGPNPPKTGESSMYLEEGEQFTLRKLVQAALVKSANDSCVAIAEAVSGNVPDFVHLMNLKAQQLGLRDTHFANPHGLHNPEHYTTAYDLAMIAKAALKKPFFNATVQTKKIQLHGNAHIPKRVYYNHNRLLMHWDKCDGVKTGYTRQAGRCLVATATQVDPVTGHRWRLLSVVLHAPNPWSDSINLLQHQGFDQYEPVQVARAGKVLSQVTIEDASSTAAAMVEKDLWLPLRPGEKDQLDVKIHPLTRKAPVQKGRIVAYIAWNKDGQKLAALPLVAQKKVERSFINRTMDSLQLQEPFYQSKLIWGALALLFLFTLFRIRSGKKHRATRRRRS